MPQVAGFFHRRLYIQKLLIVDAIIHKSVNGKIAYPEGSQVLEEVCSLAGVDAIVRQSRLYNDFRARYVRPFHRNPQPRIATAPSSGPHQYIAFARIQEPPVQFL